MKKIALILASLFYVVLFALGFVVAQEKQAEWIRVQSDDGEFSIEVPARHDYFYDENGFWVSKVSDNYRLKKVSLFTAYSENTLLSFETYQAKKGALEAIYESDKRFPKDIAVSDFERNDAAVKQLITKTDDYFYVRQYFRSKSNIYILTAASRSGENATIKRFLDSLIFKPDTKEKPDANHVLFSSLKATPVSIITAKKVEDDKNTETGKKPTEPDKDDKLKLVLLRKPAPAYVDSARMSAVQGTIRLKIHFGENGFIPKIEVVESLPEGLLRQTLFAVLRIKYLPEEKAGKAVLVRKTIDYSFAIY